MNAEVETMDEVEEDRKGFELAYGKWVEKPTGALAAWTTAKLAMWLTTFADENQLGWVLASEAGYRLFPAVPDLIRKPSLSFSAFGRFPRNRLPSGFAHLAPDLAVLSIPPKLRAAELELKIDEYLRAGVRLVWVVHPNTKAVYVYRPDGTAGRKTLADALDGEAVLPGFALRLDVLFKGL